MPKTKFICSMLVVCSFFAMAGMGQSQDIEATTVLHFNGKRTLVFFNDGDTFRIKDGEFKGTSVRIQGYNTLETYGPVHQWEGSSADYLYIVAIRATGAARRGGWRCISNNLRDTYGRLLATCDDLAISLIKKGYAHAYSVDANKADTRYLDVQKLAQAAKEGIWKYGVPKFIITSLHSADERNNKKAYNRLISTDDGTTRKWAHNDVYEECETVCVKDEPDSCMIYVPFDNRYGDARPECLLKAIGG